MPNTQSHKNKYDKIRAWLHDNKKSYGLTENDSFSVNSSRGFFELRMFKDDKFHNVGYFDVDEFIVFMESRSLIAILNIDHKTFGIPYFKKHPKDCDDVWKK